MGGVGGEGIGDVLAPTSTLPVSFRHHKLLRLSRNTLVSDASLPAVRSGESVATGENTAEDEEEAEGQEACA